MELYDHGGDVYGNKGVIHDFSVNTNPLGMPKEITDALISRAAEFSRYPDPHCRELRKAVAELESVPEDYILFGNGAADLIYRLCYALKPRSALVLAPTFSEYERALFAVGSRVNYHTLSSHNCFALTESVLDDITPETDAVFLCNPNNPTGCLAPGELLERIIAKASENGATLIIDECFLDFSGGESLKGHLEGSPKLVILKAFTKMYAMAGLRLGYLLTSDIRLRDAVYSASQCWSVSVPAQIAGVAALSLNGWTDRTRELITNEREYLSNALSELGIRVFHSDTNYLLIKSKLPLYNRLLEKGIMIRSCGNFHGLSDSFFRVCVSTRDNNIILIKAVKELLNG